jgi:hypothetical protein
LIHLWIRRLLGSKFLVCWVIISNIVRKFFSKRNLIFFFLKRDKTISLEIDFRDWLFYVHVIGFYTSTRITIKSITQG